MADVKITDLPSLSAPAAADIIPLVDDPAGSPVTKSATIRNIVPAGRAGGALTDAEGSTTSQGGAGGVGASYVKITTFDGDVSFGDVTADSTTDDDITVTTAGTYLVDFSCSFSGTASATFTATAHVNGSPDTTASFTRKLGTGGDVGSASFTSLIALSASDIVTVWVKADAASKTFTVHSACLRVTQV